MWLERVRAALVVANTNCFIYAGEEYFAVANLAGLRRTEYCLYNVIPHLVTQYDFQLDLGKKIDAVFAPTIELGVSLLPAMAAWTALRAKASHNRASSELAGMLRIR